MSRAFFRGEVGLAAISASLITSRLGAPGAPYGYAEQGKLVKEAGDSQHALCAVGDPITGKIVAMDGATAAGYGIGTVQRSSCFYATADGSQAAGTGNLAIGDFVVAGTPVAQGTALTGPVKVRKATAQPGTLAASFGDAQAQTLLLLNAWRVVSLTANGGGVPGSVVLVERVGGPD